MSVGGTCIVAGVLVTGAGGKLGVSVGGIFTVGVVGVAVGTISLVEVQVGEGVSVVAGAVGTSSVRVEVQVGEGAWVVAGGLGTDEVGNGGEN